LTVARKTPKWLVFLGVVAAVVLLTAVLAADALRSPKEHTRSDLAMNTVITQKLAGPGAEDTATAIIDAIRRIEMSSSPALSRGRIFRASTPARLTAFKSGMPPLRR
jgi:hypothetical protein